MPEEQHCMAPAITVTEDNSIPVDDDDFVEYYGLQAYVEGIICIYYILNNKIVNLILNFHRSEMHFCVCNC